MPTQPEPLILSTGQAAKRLGVGKRKLLALVKAKRLPCRMLDGRIRIALADIVAFAEALPQGYVAGKPVT